jgi:hypothetical protein
MTADHCCRFDAPILSNVKHQFYVTLDVGLPCQPRIKWRRQVHQYYPFLLCVGFCCLRKGPNDGR